MLPAAAPQRFPSTGRDGAEADSPRGKLLTKAHPPRLACASHPSREGIFMGVTHVAEAPQSMK